MGEIKPFDPSVLGVVPQDVLSTRDRILDAAERVFADKGFAAAKTQEIAKGANADKKLIFYYFGSKEDLYREVLRRFLLGMGQFAMGAEYTAGTALENLPRIGAALNDYAARNVGAVKILLREVLDNGAHFKEVLGEVLPMILKAAASNLEEHQARGELPAMDIRHFMITFGGMHLFYYLAAEAARTAWGFDPLAPEELARRKEEVNRLLLHGITPK